jgi:hypothetical protein
MNVVMWIGGGLSLIFLAASLPNGGWRSVVPILLWLAVTLPIAGALPSTAARVIALVFAFTGATLLRKWTIKRFPVTSKH